MRVFSWLRDQTTRQSRTKSRPSLGVRPRLEALEDRSVPSTLAVTRSDVDDIAVPHTLRWAVANAHNGDTILLTEAVQKSGITVVGELDLTQHDLTIRSAAALKPVTISGYHYSRIFEVSPGASVTLKGLAIADGSESNDDAGGILVDPFASLTVTGCSLAGNSALYGGAIENDGLLTLTNSTLSGNHAGSATGGGLLNIGTAIVSDCTLSGNEGGAISNFGMLTITRSIISGNTSYYAGGIYNGGMLTITCSIIASNSATLENGGGIYNVGALTVTRSIVYGNSAVDGGGIYNWFGTLTISHSAVLDNSALVGTDLFNAHGNVSVNDSIIGDRFDN
jgi:hypothetical protein